MAIKSTITSTINSFITAIITQTKLRNALSTLLDNFYPTPVYDTQATTNVFTKVDNDFTYNIKVAKIGRVVHINGWFENITGSALGSQNIVTITDSEYLPYVFAERQAIQAFSESGQVVTLGISGSSILVTSTTPSAVEFYFNGTYIVKD